MDASHHPIGGPPLLSIGAKQSTGPGHPLQRQPWAPTPKAPTFLNQPSRNVIYWLLGTAFRDTNIDIDTKEKQQFVLCFVLSVFILNFTSPKGYNFSNRQKKFTSPASLLLTPTKPKTEGFRLRKGNILAQKMSSFLSHIISNSHKYNFWEKTGHFNINK